MAFAPLLNRFGTRSRVHEVRCRSLHCIYALMLICPTQEHKHQRRFKFSFPKSTSFLYLARSGRVPAFRAGRWWTVLTAGWLHAGLLHIFFNMMWIRQLAPPTSEMYGPSRMIIIYTIAGIIGFSASTSAGRFRAYFRGSWDLRSAPPPPFSDCSGRWCTTAGARAAARSAIRRSPGHLRFSLSDSLCPESTIGLTRRLLVGGYALIEIPGSLKPERLDHLITAFICLAVTGVAIVFSILDGVRFLRVVHSSDKLPLLVVQTRRCTRLSLRSRWCFPRTTHRGAPAIQEYGLADFESWHSGEPTLQATAAPTPSDLSFLHENRLVTHALSIQRRDCFADLPVVVEFDIAESAANTPATRSRTIRIDRVLIPRVLHPFLQFAVGAVVGNVDEEQLRHLD